MSSELEYLQLNAGPPQCGKWKLTTECLVSKIEENVTILHLFIIISLFSRCLSLGVFFLILSNM